MDITGTPLLSHRFLVSWKMFSPCCGLEEASWQEKEKHVGFVRQPAFLFLDFFCVVVLPYGNFITREEILSHTILSRCFFE